jgi:hypothetical protein
MNETDKRLEIIKKVMISFDKTIFEGILLTGSMSFGKYYSIKKTSDIDLIFLTKEENANKLLNQTFFSTSKFFNIEKINLLKSERALFWCDQYIDSVKVNMGFCNFNYFKEFCNLKSKVWKGSKENKILRLKKLRTIEGNWANNKHKIEKIGDLYLWTYELYVNGELTASPFFSNLLLSEILYGQETIKKNLESLRKKLLVKYDPKKVLNLIRVVQSKLSPNYKEKINKEWRLFPKFVR